MKFILFDIGLSLSFLLYDHVDTQVSMFEFVNFHFIYRYSREEELEEEEDDDDDSYWSMTEEEELERVSIDKRE